LEEKTLNRYTSLFQDKGEKFEIVNNSIFFLYNGMVVPFGPAKEEAVITIDQAKELLERLGGKLARWNKGNFVYSEDPEWYALISSNFVSVDDVRSKLRNEIKKGISNCKVERIDAEYISKHGYHVYLNAFGRYRNNKHNFVDREAFSREMISYKNYEDLMHFWGVFHGNNLIAYSSNYIFYPTEVLYTSIKIDPDWLHLNPSYALIYHMNNYYLSENRFEYVNDGYRTLLHETNFQSFLMKNFNFVKAGLKLDVYYKPIYSLIIKGLYPVKGFAGKVDNRLEAVLKLEKIRRSYNEGC
jgi:hypothetical protein